MTTTDRKHYQMLIGGERVDADEVFEIVSPAIQTTGGTLTTQATAPRNLGFDH